VKVATSGVRVDWGGRLRTADKLRITERCSITSFVLSTPTLRTCVGCNRKAFMPLGEDVFQPHTVRGWFVQELLKAVTRCLFCGNTFVTLV
jgi:general transcription factor 3C protein 4